MAGAVLLRRTTIIGQDTLIAVIAIFVIVIKRTFFYAVFPVVLILTAILLYEIGVIAVFVSRDAGLVTGKPI